MIVLGVDGMDPKLLREMMDAGKAPNLARLAKEGGFVPLGTSNPPQSPVAWSNFITGMDSGQHGIFDFLHLDRQSMIPYQSTARVQPASRAPLAVGKWRIPLASDTTLQLRDGAAFWEILEDHGIRSTLFQIPANYPPIHAGAAVSGMGTPDMKGTPGTFAYYTDDPAFKAGPVSGGVIHRIERGQNAIHAFLEGPPNAFVAGAPYAKREFTIRVDPSNPVALIELGDQRILLNEGEWSDWLTADFQLLPALVSVSGMVRFYLRESSPHIALYASPVNIDPRAPAQPISFPSDYAEQLAEAAGPFYTQEMPEDTKALSAHVLNPRQFLQQSGLVLEERRRLLRQQLRQFKADGAPDLLFFYFSSVDQRNHMLERQADPAHPFHDADTPADLAAAMQTTYREIDELVGETMRQLPAGAALVVMSDHGFAPFRRQANVNTWLEQHGYLVLKDPARRDEYEWLQGIDWEKTRAFAIGLNSLYLNVRGRERNGIVPVASRAALAREIAVGLESWKDPLSDERVVTHAALREDIYHGPHLKEAPDIIVGYARGYRASWATTAGRVPRELIEDNDEEWSGDHCIDPREVPGVLIVNRPIKASEPDLMDLTATILSYFDVKPASGMRGKPAF
jgi:predicted AlkP superfamily phosphohydrolase/phosphomutase